jgi:hypothetical protein
LTSIFLWIFIYEIDLISYLFIYSKMSFPYEIMEMDEVTHKQLRADYIGETKGFLQVRETRDIEGKSWLQAIYPS